jgi:hypothetical protein
MVGPVGGRPEESGKMDVFVPQYQFLPGGGRFVARLKQWSQTPAISAEAGTFCLEVAKFLGTVALILASALILLMAG